MRGPLLSIQFLIISYRYRGQGLIGQNLEGFGIDPSFGGLLASRHLIGFIRE